MLSKFMYGVVCAAVLVSVSEAGLPVLIPFDPSGIQMLSCLMVRLASRYVASSSSCLNAARVQDANSGRDYEVTGKVPYNEDDGRKFRARRFLSKVVGMKDYPSYLKEVSYKSNDIVLFELDEPDCDDQTLLSAKNRFDETPGTTGVVSFLTEDDCGEPLVQEVNSTIISREDCLAEIKDFAEKNGYDTNSDVFCDLAQSEANICSTTNYGRKICDVGGVPFGTKSKDGRDVFVGLATPLFQCEDVQGSNVPLVYTSVAEFADFIEKYVDDAEFHQPYC